MQNLSGNIFFMSNHKKVAKKFVISWKMCNFAAET